MPFDSKAQHRYLSKFKPEIAKEFAERTKNMKSLPERKKLKKKLPVVPKIK